MQFGHKMEVHLVQWPEFRTLAERTRGHLDALESLDVLLQGLVAKTEAVVTPARIVWSCGQDMESIRVRGPLIESEPRGVLEELDTHQPFIDLVIPLIEQLQSLDTSIDGSSRVAELLVDLRSAGAGLQMRSNWQEIGCNWPKIEEYVTESFLDRARIELATLWPVEIDPNSLQFIGI